MTGVCAACGGGDSHATCRGAFRNRGVVKVHWECWSDCNLTCGFCYRTRGKSLDTPQAQVLLSAVAASGAAAVVFAGGDPTLRRDLIHLVSWARGLDLNVEVQTNAHYVPTETLRCLTGPSVDLVGLSLDGATVESHDALRETRGNFDRVFKLLDACRAAGKPTIVRTVVNARNLRELTEIGLLLADYDNVVRWSLLEFTEIGDGYANASKFALPHDIYEAAAGAAAKSYRGSAHVDVYRGEAKVGTYALLTPDGQLYGTTTSVGGRYPLLGNILDRHLDELAAALALNAVHHRQRYGDGLAPELPTA